MGMDLEFHIEKYVSECKSWEFVDVELYGRNSELYEMLKQFGYTGRKMPEDLSPITKSWIDDVNLYGYGWFNIYDFKTRLKATECIKRTGYLSLEQYHDLMKHDKKPCIWSSFPTDEAPLLTTWNSNDLHCLTSLNEMIDLVAKRNNVQDMVEWGLISRVIYILV